ncbi:MAG: hypothetical protein J5720_01265, partial [Bacteroidaceae bacterium]|nr:hypothetical protein [Bacteroidaceae bacterium]
FSENDKNRAINAIMRVMECINIRPSQIGTEKTVREGKLAATRGNTCSLARVQKGYGVGGSKQHRCFGKTTAYKWQNNAVVFVPEKQEY